MSKIVKSVINELEKTDAALESIGETIDSVFEIFEDNESKFTEEEWNELNRMIESRQDAQEFCQSLSVILRDK